MGQTQGRVLITGATSGIGEATARLLAKKGRELVLVARRQDRLAKLQAELGKSTSVETFVVDVSSAESCAQFFQNDKLLSQVDVLINNAGLALGVEKFHASQPEQWDAMLDTNVKGVLRFLRALVPHMLKNNRGDIVNLGSVAGRWVYPGGAVYCASKFAVRAISESLRMDLLGTPIRVINIEPGMVETEFSVVRLADEQKAKNVYAGMQPLTAEDIAESIVWTLSRPSHVNIQELVIFPTDQAAVGPYVHRR